MFTERTALSWRVWRVISKDYSDAFEFSWRQIPFNSLVPWGLCFLPVIFSVSRSSWTSWITDCVSRVSRMWPVWACHSAQVGKGSKGFYCKWEVERSGICGKLLSGNGPQVPQLCRKCGGPNMGVPLCSGRHEWVQVDPVLNLKSFWRQ